MAAAAAPTGAAAPRRQASLIEADSFVDRVVDGERVSYGYGNVVIDRDSLVALCDTAVYYRDRGFYELHGHVQLTQAGGVLNCRRAVYSLDGGTGDFFGDVRVQEGEMTATGRLGESRAEGRFLRMMGDALLVMPEYSVLADTVFRDRLTGEGEAFGNVRIMEPGANSLVTGEHARFEAAGQVAIIDSNPHLTSRGQGGGPLTSSSRVMHFYREEDRVVMIDSVRIHHDRTDAKADTAIAYGRERLVLRGSPEVDMGGQSVMFGDQIEFFYQDGELRRMILVGAARMEDAAPDSLAALYGGLPAMDVLAGDSITVDFEDDQVHRSVVVGSAHSIYTPLDLDGEVATNDVLGDTIVIDFRQGKVSRVNVNGEMSGTYRFAKIADMTRREGRRLADADSVAAAMVESAADSLTETTIDSMVVAIADTAFFAAPDTSSVPALPAGRLFQNASQDVVYSGGALDFKMRDRAIDISRNGVLVFGTMKLSADHIKLDTDERELYAEGSPLVEDSDVIAGEQMGYNFGHKTGAVASGVTAFDDYYYSGDEIRRYPDTTMKICSGKMTSCDLEKPHYHFWSEKMKIRMKDKIVAAPIVLRVGEVPIFALPFFFRNLKEGRRSGILFPSFDFGFSSREGRYIRDFGYYWATNDYTDILFEGDYNERKDLAYRISNRYVKRYTMRGGVDFSRKVGLGNNNLREWQLRWNHSQPELLDDYKFTADVKLASQSLSSDDLAGSVRRDIIPGQRVSKFSISRGFSFGSMNLNARRDERANVADDYAWTDTLLSTTTLPGLSVNFNKFTLAPQLRAGQKGSLLGDLLRNTHFDHDYTYQADRTAYEMTTIKKYSASGKWSLSVIPPKVGIFSFKFSANASQAWRRDSTEGQEWIAATDTTDGYLQDVSEWEEETTPAASFGAGLGTKLYGVMPVPVGKLRAIRHTVSMDTGWRQRVGLNGKPPSSSFSLSMTNRLDAKYVSATSDTSEVEKKLDGFFDWSLNTSYDPQADDGERWSDISSRMTIKPGQNQYLKLTVTNVIDPVKLALKSTNFNYRLSMNFKGRLDVGEIGELEEAQRNTAIDRLGDSARPADADSVVAEDEWGEPGDDQFGQEDDSYGDEEGSFNDFYNRPDRQQKGDDKDKTEGGRYLPFELRPSVNYGYNSKTESRHKATGQLTATANLTRNWDFRYTTSFDLVTSTATRQQFSLNRDLHCWRLEFNRTVSAVDSQFGFRIYLKAIPALKYTRGREDSMGSLSSGMAGF
jgi:lipopolysaccharide assembly outer membrane protein LptD (OstA)